MITAVVVCVDPDTDGGVVVSADPGGSILNSSKVTFNAASISGPLVNSTAQVSVTLAPKGGTITWLGMLVDSVMEVGAGTANDYDNYRIDYHIMYRAFLTNKAHFELLYQES